MKLRHLFIILLSSLALLARADNVTLKQAEAYAHRFFHQYTGVSSADTRLQLAWDGQTSPSRSAGTQPPFYVFNRGTDQGFVIISGDDTSRPVLAYSYQGTFSPHNLPSNVKAWMQSMAGNIKGRSSQPTSRAAAQAAEWDNTVVQGRTVSLATPLWDQDSPYNLKCPVVYGRHCYTGCAITATAIVMGYHQWPDKGVGTLPRYTTPEHKFSIGPIALGETYRWDLMPYINDNYPEWNNPQQDDAISTIMYHVGVMGRADYTTYGTSATLRSMAEGLPLYMKYNPQLRYLERQHYTDQEWSRMLREEIDAQRPVIYEGFDENEGHAFVIDGYDEAGYFSVNWGWGGRYNAFYLLDDMAPGMQGIGANGSGTYNLSQAGIFGLRPRPDSEVDLDNLQYIASQSFSSGLVVENLTLPVHKGDGFWIDTGILRNMGSNIANGTLRLAMTDHKGNIIESYKDEEVTNLSPSVNMTFSYYKTWITIGHEVQPGYRLRLLFQPQGTGQWKPVTCPPEVGSWEALLMEGEAPDEQSLEVATSLQYDCRSRLITLTTLEGVTASLNHSSGQDCSSALSISGSTITIAGQPLQKGLYVLTLKKGTDQIELHLRF